MFLLSVACGFFLAWLFQRNCQKVALRLSANRMIAHVLEFRLFMDEPGVIFHAQRALLRENLRMLRLLIQPSAVVGIPSLLIFFLFNGFLGYEALPLGKPVVITAPVRGTDLRAAPPCANTPAIRIPRLNQVSWRVVPTESCPGGIWKGPQVGGLQVPYPIACNFGEPWWIYSLLGFTVGGLVYWKVNG